MRPMVDREEGKSLGVGNGMQSGIEEAKLPWTVEGIQPGREGVCSLGWWRVCFLRWWSVCFLRWWRVCFLSWWCLPENQFDVGLLSWWWR